MLSGRAEIEEADLAYAARTVLAGRATQLPPEPADQPPPQEERPEDTPRTTDKLEDRVLEAARAALPAHLLEALAAGSHRTGRGGHGQGDRQRSKLRGRPLGARAGLPRGAARLALIDTLRAAAPWQALRRRGDPSRRLHLRRDDLRIRRFEERSPTLTIFAVDASGSAAAARLAEAKGAVELLLQQSYARRAEVALLAFRGTTAELLLPPTRSLTRARRLLGDLPGGGGTPLAAGMDAARLVAEAAAARGRTPTLVVLTDGRANIAADGSQGRPAAQADAVAAARRIAQSGLTALLIDIGARAQPEAASLAKAMAARYLHLPRADAGAVHAALDA
jgi:magnesium chelatase subunit D